METVTGNLIDINPPSLPPTTTNNTGSQEVLSKAAEQMKQLSMEASQVQVRAEITDNGLSATVKEPAKQNASTPAPAAAAKDSQPKPSPRTTTANNSAKVNSSKVTAASPTDKKPKPPSSATATPQTKSRPSNKTNGESPKKTTTPTSAATAKKPSPATTPTAGPGTARTRPAASPTTNSVATARAAASARRPSQNSPNTVAGAEDGTEVKKVPMNKIKVGNTPSPNIKEVKSKVGSLASASTHRPGGGNVKIAQTKLNWKAESKIGSLSNVGYQPAGGNVKVESKKVEMKAVSSKIGSLQNVKHKPGGGEKKIFDDKEYLKQVSPSSKTPSERGGSSIPHSPTPGALGNLGAGDA